MRTKPNEIARNMESRLRRQRLFSWIRSHARSKTPCTRKTKIDLSVLEAPGSEGWLSWYSLIAELGFASSALGWRRAVRDKIMNSRTKGKVRINSKSTRDEEMLAEYDFSQGVRAKYAKRMAEGSNLIVLSPDVAEFFPDSESVNLALRSIVDIAQNLAEALSRSRAAKAEVTIGPRLDRAPVPGAFLHWEGPPEAERGVDFVTPFPLLFVGSNIVILALLAGLPIACVFLRRRRVDAEGMIRGENL